MHVSTVHGEHEVEVAHEYEFLLHGFEMAADADAARHVAAPLGERLFLLFFHARTYRRGKKVRRAAAFQKRGDVAAARVVSRKSTARNVQPTVNMTWRRDAFGEPRGVVYAAQHTLIALFGAV